MSKGATIRRAIFTAQLARAAEKAAVEAAAAEARSEETIRRRIEAGNPPSSEELARNRGTLRLLSKIAERRQREFEEYVARHLMCQQCEDTPATWIWRDYYNPGSAAVKRFSTRDRLLCDEHPAVQANPLGSWARIEKVR